MDSSKSISQSQSASLSNPHVSPSKAKFSLVFPHSLTNPTDDLNSFSSHPSSNNYSDREKEVLFRRTVEILSKSGEQRNPKELRVLMKATEGFQYFQRLKEKKSTAVLHSRFCRVMKLKKLKKGETLFYAGDAADRFYIILKGKVVIFVPKSALDLFEEKLKSIHDPEITEKCMKTLKANESKTVAFSPTANLFHAPRKSALLELARKPIKARTSEENRVFISQKEKKKWSITSLDQSFKVVLKRNVYETLKVEDLDSPWRYFTDGVFHYNVGNLLKEGDFFGELGLLTKKPRKATVLSFEESYLIYLEKDDYKNVVQSVDFGKITRKIDFFERHFLRGFTQDGILKLSYFFLKRKFGLNQIVYEENEAVDGCYLIKKGEISLNKHVLSQEEDTDDIEPIRKSPTSFTNVCTVGPGDFFGEIEVLFKATKRQATAISRTTKLVVFFIEKDLFLRTISDKSSLLQTFVKTAETKHIWFKTQLQKKIEVQQEITKDTIRVKSFSLHEQGSSESLPNLKRRGYVRASISDIRLENSKENTSIQPNKSTIRGKSSAIGDGSFDFNALSQAEKIRKLIENNTIFEDRVRTRQPILDISNSFFNCRKKSRSFYLRKDEKPDQNHEETLRKTTQRLFSSTFYLQNRETKDNFFRKSAQKKEKQECSKERGENLGEKREQTMVFKIEGESLRTTLNELRGKRERFQMEVRNFKPNEFFLRRTKHRQFFSMMKQKKRAVSAKG